MSSMIGESSNSPSNGGRSRRASPFIAISSSFNNNNNDDYPILSNPIIRSSSNEIPANRLEKSQSNAENEEGRKNKREVYRYKANWLISTLAWSNDIIQESFDLAIGSFIEDHCNQIEIVRLKKDSYGEEIQLITSFDHPYPATKISWIPKKPESISALPPLFATSADYLRLWSLNHDKFDIDSNQQTIDQDNSWKEHEATNIRDGLVHQECLLNVNSGARYSAPLTSFDWNEIDPRVIVTSSVDTTCAIWDIETETQISSINQQNHAKCLLNGNISYKLKNQIVAHNHEVYDVSFSRQGSGRDVFVTAGGDGSLRLFDLRKLSTSSVLYDTADDRKVIGYKALMRVECNKQNSNYVSTFALDSKEIILIDVRNCGQPIAILRSHTENLNGISWAPHSAHHICSVSDDQQALIWEITKIPEPVNEPLLAYRACGKTNVVNWSSSHPDWIAIGFDNYLELLRV